MYTAASGHSEIFLAWRADSVAEERTVFGLGILENHNNEDGIRDLFGGKHPKIPVTYMCVLHAAWEARIIVANLQFVAFLSLTFFSIDKHLPKQSERTG